ncbi:MAG TPA: hypothetical protein VMI53_05825 [Opitutaceae bacterium]|nr:hypothetical protein [Opitutaceae bacterium]
MSFPKTTERFVAYFDIMGFKDLIYRHDHSVVSNLLDRVSANVADIKEWEGELLEKRSKIKKRNIHKGIVLPVMFSDSVIFISRSNSVWDARKTIYVASYFLYNMFSTCVPVRGAIAYGIFTADFKASKFFGRPLVDAYILSEETNFYGAVLHHSIEDRLHVCNEITPENIIKRMPVPMKAGLVTHSFVDWRSWLDDSINFHSIMEPFYRSVSGSTRRYVDNTLSIYGEEP